VAEPAKVVVLNVDDYEPNRYARTQTLRRAGFEVHEAATGNEALRVAMSHNPAVVLLDVNLPDMDGFEVCRRLKTEPRTAMIAVLHLSATFVNPGHRALGLEGGADGYLTEPVEPPVLIATINALLRMRRAEERARQLAQQWQATFDAIRDGVAVLNTAGTVLQCNEAFLRIFGRAGTEVAGTTVTQLWGARPSTEPEQPFMRLLLSCRRETGTMSFRDRWYDVTADPVVDEEAALIGCVHIVHDVTERQHAEEERASLLAAEQAARAEAEAANRAKDEFLATVSHELRAPLTAMLGWTRMLRSRMLDETASQHALETIERNVAIQTRLIEDLLDVSRIITGRLRLDVRAVDLNAIIREALDAVLPAAEAKAIHVEAVLEPAAARFLGDPARLQQVVWNLVSNAVKFTATGGRVEVRLEIDGTEARITVTDTGQGISPEFLPHVFERFRQAESSSGRVHGGLGLGLAIVRHLVELHGGTVRAASSGIGRGSTFSVTLPCRAMEPAAPSAPARTPALPTLEGIRVLVVDDDADARDLLGMVLTQARADVVTVASSREALALLEEAPPDVIVSDIGLPEENGYDLIRRVRALAAKNGGEIPAIALTGHARTEDQGRALAAGYQVHVAKPVEPAALISAIASVVGR
jgi:PAS domain S-box-containing protein